MTRTAMEEEGENKDIVLGGEDLFVDGKILRRTGHVFAGSRGLVKTCQLMILNRWSKLAS
jgi:hypothetical protein